MPQFNYIARDSSGSKVTGTEEGNGRDELIVRLQAKGLTVISVSSVIGTSKKIPQEQVGQSKTKRRHSGINLNDLCLFSRQLATLLEAGVTIIDALAIIQRQVSSQRLFDVINRLRKGMEEGLSLHEAMAKEPKIFSGLWVNLVESGEASGNLAIVLSRLANYLERNAKFKNDIISALIYPVILLFVGTGALLFLSLKLIPTFAELFASFNTELPYLTKILIVISNFLRRFFLLLVLIGAGLVSAFKWFIGRPEGRKKFEGILFKLPVFGDFFRNISVEKFSSTMTTLTESGVPILYALEISERSVDNLVMAEVIHQVKEEVRQGRSLSVPMEKSGFFEPMIVQMINIGEEVGDLSGMFNKVNVYYQEAVERFLTRITAMFEPIMLVFMGGIIGIMVVGMFLPIFQISKIGAAGG